MLGFVVNWTSMLVWSFLFTGWECLTCLILFLSAVYRKVSTFPWSLQGTTPTSPPLPVLTFTSLVMVASFYRGLTKTSLLISRTLLQISSRILWLGPCCTFLLSSIVFPCGYISPKLLSGRFQSLDFMMPFIFHSVLTDSSVHQDHQIIN